MSSKRARGSKEATASTGSPSRDETESLIRKGRFKDAVKQAKLCFKEESTLENRRLLERAYYLRARQLVQLGMRSSAIEVARHLLDFGVNSSEWTDEFIRLLMDLGLGQEALAIQGRIGTPELKDHLAVMAADLAVIYPDRAKATSPDIAVQATLVRQALERLQSKDEAGALLLLRDLGRSSVLSEWKFFIRGLAAYYRQEPEDIKANWDRLDPGRKAFSLAQRLLEVVGGSAGDTIRPNTEALEKLAFGEPVLDRLRRVRALAASQEWDQVFRLLGPLRLSLHRIDRRLAERLTGALVGSVIKETGNLDFADAKRLINGFTGATEPMAFDPNWNRLWAIIWDGPRGDVDVSLKYWAKYVDDLTTVTVFNSSERALAQAMVWNHMAGTHRDLAADLADPEGPFGLPLSVKIQSGSDSAEVKRAKKQVIHCLEQSLRLAPAHLPTYELLVEVYRGWEDQANLEAAARRLLTKFPENLETLRLLAEQYIEKNDPAAALPLVQTARGLKPLDESLRLLEWTIRIGLARIQAVAKRWDAGRDEFNAAEQLQPECRNQYFYLARRVIFEAKASQAEQSDRYLEQAKATLNDPTPLWLALAIESIRYGMTKATQKGYAQVWEAELKNKCTSQAAGGMASLLYGFVTARIEYTGRAGHIKKVVTYLQRTTRLNYRCDDIEQVCEFLGQLQDKVTLLEKLVKLGVKQHPRSVLLNFRAGLLETGKGLFDFGGMQSRKYLETARKLAEASNDPKETALLPPIQSALTLLNEMSSGRMGLPAFGNGPPGFHMPVPSDNFFDFFNVPDDDDDEFDDDEFGPSSPPRPLPASKAKKQKTRKKR